MCTENQTKTEIKSIIGYKMFKLKDAELYSPFSLDYEECPSYDTYEINVCNSSEGFHVFADKSLAKSVLDFMNGGNSIFVLYKVRAIDVHTIGVWSDTKFHLFGHHCGIVMQCDQLEILERVE